MNPGKADKKIDTISFAVYFVGWVKPYTAYPAKEAFWTAELFPGLTMKIMFLKDEIRYRTMLGTLGLSQPTSILSHVLECGARQSDTRL